MNKEKTTIRHLKKISIIFFKWRIVVFSLACFVFTLLKSKLYPLSLGAYLEFLLSLPA